MRSWGRLRVAEPCGFCGERQPVGAVALIITLPLSRSRRIRCIACAGEPVCLAQLDADDVAFIRQAEINQAIRAANAAALAALIVQDAPRDVKRDQAGEVVAARMEDQHGEEGGGEEASGETESAAAHAGAAGPRGPDDRAA